MKGAARDTEGQRLSRRIAVPPRTLPPHHRGGDKLEDLEETEASGAYNHDPAPAQVNMEPRAEGLSFSVPIARVTVSGCQQRYQVRKHRRDKASTGPRLGCDAEFGAVPLGTRNDCRVHMLGSDSLPAVFCM